MRTHLRSLLGASAVLCLLLAGMAPATAATGATDWPTWGYDNSRMGYNPNETILSPSTVAGLHKVWRFAFHAKTYNAPILAAGVDVNGTPTDLVLAGDMGGNFYAFSAATGAVVWQRNFGSVPDPCYGFPAFGVIDTAVIDRSTNRVYVVGADGNLYALDLGTGATANGWPVQVTEHPNEYVWGGLNLFDGHVYVPVASYCDRNGQYFGRLTQIDTVTAMKTATFYVTNGPTTGISGGGIWGWGGASIDPANASVYVTTGNAVTTPESYLYSEHIVRLTEGLSVAAAHYPGVTITDADFGSSPILYQGPGTCGPQLATVNKDGELFVYNRDAINSGPVDRVVFSGSETIVVPAFSPVTDMIYVGNPAATLDGTYKSGLLAFRVRSSDCKLELAWQHQLGLTGGTTAAPVVANGVVYYGDGKGHMLHAFDATTGAELWSSGLVIRTGTSTEPIVVNGRVYITTGSKIIAFGL